jgi:hypothetical protein
MTTLFHVRPTPKQRNLDKKVASDEELIQEDTSPLLKKRTGNVKLL